MKAIAEYFRDLAAEDRYFGAVPPTPDAEMLARIAEKEIARRVEARMEASGIVLRAALAGDMVAAPEPVAGAGPGAAHGEVPPATRTPPETQPVPAAEAEPLVPPRPAIQPGTSDGLAARLERIRAVAGRAALSSPEEEEIRPAAAAVPPAGEPRPDPATAPGSDSAIAAEATEDATELAAPETESRHSAVLPEEVTAPALGSGAQDASPHPSTETPVWPRVIRLPRAAAEKMEEADAAEDAEAVSPDRPTEPRRLSAEEEADLQAELAAIEAELAATAPASEPEQGPATAEPASAGDMADLARSAAAAAAAAMAASVAERAAEALRPSPEEPARADRRPVEAEPETAPAAKAGEAGADADEDASGPSVTAARDSGDGATQPELPLAADALFAAAAVSPIVEAAPDRPEEDADLPPDRAAAARVDAFLAELENRDGIATPAVPAAETAAEPLPADIAADPTGETGSEPVVASDEGKDGDASAGPAPLPAARHGLPEGPDGDEAAVSRLLSRTDEVLLDPETQRRREAIAQLKAAVAATEAARRLRGNADEPDHEADRTEVFRQDLRETVRPRRPVATTALERSRPAPLRLVASQRVDLPAPEPAPRAAPAAAAGPVRPRRVTLDSLGSEATARPEAVRQVASSFAAFAAETGATSLKDILEAAAVYTAVIEGEEDFSRPQIIEKVREVSSDRFSREDGLRSFGALLREGRITRVRGGRFQVSEDSRFHPGQRTG
ncbi:hypothetical protein GT358_05590 [Rubellimicrobium sp. CFH 75288]|nr:hypothetical protein [Rubellimicrobium sp. CFH 75288]